MSYFPEDYGSMEHVAKRAQSIADAKRRLSVKPPATRRYKPPFLTRIFRAVWAWL